MFSAVFNLSTLNGGNGFVIDNSNIPSYLFVSSAGDINKDGIADMLFANQNANKNTGQSYVLFGYQYFPPIFAVSNINAQCGLTSCGFMINGINQNDQSGSITASLGDINGDGTDDIAIGAPYALNNTGQSYVVFGNDQGFNPVFNLTSLNGTNGFAINGASDNPNGDLFGSSLVGAGDINADGINDIIVGAPGALNQAGQAYVIFGSKNPFPAYINVTGLNGNNGFVINGVNNDDQLGISLSGGRDINGDKISDVIIGAEYASGGIGQSYVVFGSKDAFPVQFNLTNLNGQNGFVINGTFLTGSLLGDFNQDGLADMVTVGNTIAMYSNWEIYTIFGNSNFPSLYNPTNLTGQDGFTVQSTKLFTDYGNVSMSNVGDVNLDGIEDIIIGLDGANYQEIGQSYIIFGNNNSFNATLNLANLNGQNGFIINGNSHEFSGYSVTNTGDVNADGIDDIMLGAMGQAYVIYGQSSSQFDGDLFT